MAESFVPIEDFSNYLDRDVGDDLVAQFALEAACQTIRTYLDRQVNAEDGQTIRVSGSGTDVLLLPNWPVRDITSIIVDDEDLPELDEAAEANWRFGSSGMVFRTDLQVWPRGHENIQIIYSSGWPFDQFYDDPEEVPADIKFVAMLVARRIYALRGATVTGALKSETIGRYSYTLSDTADETIGGLAENERAALDKYVSRSM